MAAIESVKDSMPATTDAEILTKMSEAGEISAKIRTTVIHDYPFVDQLGKS